MQSKFVSISAWFASDNNRVRLALILAGLVISVLATGTIALAGDATSGSG
jgi:hypothetical protein